MKFYVTPITNAEALTIQSLAEIRGEGTMPAIHHILVRLDKKYTVQDLREALELLETKGIVKCTDKRWHFTNRQPTENDIMKPEVWSIDTLGVNLSRSDYE